MGKVRNVISAFSMGENHRIFFAPRKMPGTRPLRGRGGKCPEDQQFFMARPDLKLL